MDDFSGLISPAAIIDMKLDETSDDEEASEEHLVGEEDNGSLSVDDDVIDGEEDKQPSPVSSELLSVKTTGRDSSGNSSLPSTETLEDYQMPEINYSRDTPTQYLVAVIGRDVDEPSIVSGQLQQLSPRDGNDAYIIKFVPYSIKRCVLTRPSTNWSYITHYDVVCMCYNASEARLMLTGQDGFYTQLLRQVEILLG